MVAAFSLMFTIKFLNIRISALFWHRRIAFLLPSSVRQIKLFFRFTHCNTTIICLVLIGPVFLTCPYQFQFRDKLPSSFYRPSHSAGFIGFLWKPLSRRNIVQCQISEFISVLPEHSARFLCLAWTICLLFLANYICRSFLLLCCCCCCCNCQVTFNYI